MSKGNVVDLDSRRPHTEGTAVCLTCKHTWEAVAPIGTISLECPSCKLNTGAYKNLCLPDDAIWECNCGCNHFVITEKYVYCAKCGLAQEF